MSLCDGSPIQHVAVAKTKFTRSSPVSRLRTHLRQSVNNTTTSRVIDSYPTRTNEPTCDDAFPFKIWEDWDENDTLFFVIVVLLAWMPLCLVICQLRGLDMVDLNIARESLPLIVGSSSLVV